MRRVVSLLIAGLFVLCGSCNGDNIYPVSGKVTYNGSPASGAAVFFVRQGRRSAGEGATMGVVREDGSFEVACGSLGKGARPGEYNVLIEWRVVSRGSKGRPQRGPDKLKRRYADPQLPLLHATVEAKTNELPPFDLRD